MGEWYVESSAWVVALGGPHPDREDCRRLLDPGSNVRLHGSVEVVQELVHHRMRRCDRHQAVAESRAVAEVMDLHPFDGAVLDEALELIMTTPIRGRDAVHAATARLIGCESVVTLDADFAAVPGLRVVHPRDVAQ